MWLIIGSLHNCVYCSELIGKLVTQSELVDLICFYDCYIDADYWG